jgi:rubrerythrin
MDIAVTMERKAAERFETLANELARQGNRETADLFHQLAEDERTHESEIARWSRRVDDHAPIPADFHWRMPETFELAETETSPRTLTPYRALSVAMRNEEHAFTFYSYLATTTGDEAVCKRAEALARSELDHVARLRAYRRRAYHLGHDGNSASHIRIVSLDGLRQLALDLHTGASALYALLTRACEKTDDSDLTELLRHLSGLLLASKPTAAADQQCPVIAASKAVEDARASGLLEPGTLTPLGILRLMLMDAEETVQTFHEIAEQSQDEAIVSAAQAFAEDNLCRLAVITIRLNLMHDESHGT